MTEQTRPDDAAINRLLDLLNRQEQRRERLGRQIRLLSVTLVACLLLGGLWAADAVREANAGVIKDLKMDIKNLNAILANMADLLQVLNNQDMRDALTRVDDIIKEAEASLASGGIQKSLEGIGNALKDVDDMAVDMRRMTIHMSRMDTNMAVMAGGMDSTMGRMGRMMPWMP